MQKWVGNMRAALIICSPKGHMCMHVQQSVIWVKPNMHSSQYLIKPNPCGSIQALVQSGLGLKNNNRKPKPIQGIESSPASDSTNMAMLQDVCSRQFPGIGNSYSSENIVYSSYIPGSVDSNYARTQFPAQPHPPHHQAPNAAPIEHELDASHRVYPFTVAGTPVSPPPHHHQVRQQQSQFLGNYYHPAPFQMGPASTPSSMMSLSGSSSSFSVPPLTASPSSQARAAGVIAAQAQGSVRHSRPAVPANPSAPVMGTSPYGHHQHMPVQVPVVDYTSKFASSGGVRKSSKKAHSCMLCGKVFARPSALQTHIYSHTGEKPFKCDHTGCGRSFSVVSNLRRHKRVHMR